MDRNQAIELWHHLTTVRAEIFDLLVASKYTDVSLRNLWQAIGFEQAELEATFGFGTGVL